MKHKEFATLMLATFMACAVAVSGCSRTDSGNGVDNTGAGSAGKEQTDDYQASDYAYVPAISQQKMETDADDADVMVTRRADLPHSHSTSALDASRANTERAARTVLPHSGQR